MIAAAGLLLFAFGSAHAVWEEDIPWGLEAIWYAILQRRPWGDIYWPAAWGAYLLLIGAVLALPQPARILAWICHGHTQPDR